MNKDNEPQLRINRELWTGPKCHIQVLRVNRLE